MNFLSLSLLALLTIFPSGQQDQDEIDMYLQKAYPKAPAGMVRYVIRLPHKTRDEEGNYRVEVAVGKTMMTDGVNHYFLNAQMEKKTAKGWGFDYYEVKKIGPAASTLMGVLPGTKPVKKFVSGQPKLMGYNSRLPIVVYVPKDAEVRYRVFEAKKQKKAKKG